MEWSAEVAPHHKEARVSTSAVTVPYHRSLRSRLRNHAAALPLLTVSSPTSPTVHSTPLTAIKPFILSHYPVTYTCSCTHSKYG
nr:hypothetical protein Itr_chr04CG05280 [Ipomoea trifida]